jgi:polyphosphate kinase
MSDESALSVPSVATSDTSVPAASESAPDLTDPAFYLNRELSLVEFQRRVLAQANEPSVPLLERLRFCTIFSSIIDEFFEIRVAGLKQGAALGLGARGPDGMEPAEVLAHISDRLHAMVDEQYHLLSHVLLPELRKKGVRVVKRGELTADLAKWVKGYFCAQVLPVLTPLGLDPAHPFPNVQNKGLAFIVSLEGDDAFGRTSGVAIVQVPRCLPRLIHLPLELSEGPDDFMMLSGVVHAHVGMLFPGMTVTGCHQFRVTRNSDLWVDEEAIDDLLSALKMELPGRQYGNAVRLEVADNISASNVDFLVDHFGLATHDVYKVNGPVNLHRLEALCNMVERPDLKYRPFAPGVPDVIGPKADLFDIVGKRDVLLHHPYQSFAPVLELVRQAAEDPNVLAIKQTLYRTGADSPVVDALIDAARAGKDITVVVELRARFDEADNIRLATRLQEAGANVVYGVVGYKTHAKVLMVVRREGGKLRRYVHMGTGNYHHRTARFYTDFSLMSANTQLGEDLHALFMSLTGLGRATKQVELLQSPFTLHRRTVELIVAEAAAAARGEEAWIKAKMNSLTEPELIQALYRASQAGVSIVLIVRGVCRLRPGIPGVSENIEIRSIVGRFLEHSRVFRCCAGGKGIVYCSSADWMERNMFRRVETCFPVLDDACRARVADEGLETYLRDDAAAWVLQQDGTYCRREVVGTEPFNAQQHLMEALGR